MQMIIITPLVLIFSLSAKNAYAYLGPGLAVGTIGTVVGLLGVVIIALSAIIWYPLKTILRKIVKTKSNKSALGREDN